MPHIIELIDVLRANIKTVEETNEIVQMLESGLITETERAKKLIDLATRKQALPVSVLGEIADTAFPYGVSVGKYDSDGNEDCKYCDDFASLRDAIIAWEEYSPGCAWSRVEHRIDDFVYGLDPYKVLRAKKVTDDKGEQRTLYYRCHADGQFID